MREPIVGPIVQRLVTTIDEAWRRVGFAQRDLPAVAAAALERVAPHRHLDCRAAITALAAGEGRDVCAGIHGSPQIVPLFEGPRFTVSLHLWHDDLQTPHSHAWSGAYQVLLGTSVHGAFSFREELRYDAKFLLGSLHLDRLELLDPGATIPVARGMAMIHGVSYLEPLGVAISVRSSENGGALTHDFLAPGVAIQGSHVDRLTQQRLLCLDGLCAVSPDRTFDTLAAVLATADPRSAFWLLRHAAVHYRRRLDVDRLFAIAAPTFGRHGGAVQRAIEVWEREVLLRVRRRLVRDPDHRLLLAVLHLARDRRELERLVALRRAEPAAAFVRRCLVEMASQPGDPGWTLLGTPSGSDFAVLLGLLLDDDRVDSVLRRLEDGYDADDVRALAPLVRAGCEALRGLPVLRPVFFPQSHGVAP
jgi:hypothetical protein